MDRFAVVPVDLEAAQAAATVRTTVPALHRSLAIPIRRDERDTVEPCDRRCTLPKEITKQEVRD